MSRSRDQRPAGAPSERTGLTGGLIAVAGGALMVSAAFLSWLTTATDTGGISSISGFGAISGDNSVAGGNLNDLLATGGLGTYRPGLIGLVFGITAILSGSTVAAVRPSGQRPFRIAACLILLAGVAGAGWGVLRGMAPGTGGVFTDGSGNAGVGPWVTATGGVLLLLVAGWLFAGRADRTVVAAGRRHRGIQPG
jgi:hypothetical protein